MGQTHSDENERCDVCGSVKDEFDVFDPDTYEVVGTNMVCPNEWMGRHRRVEKEQTA